MINEMQPKTLKRVAIVGPECTGKSDLSEFLARHYKTSFAPEYARGYIDNLNRPYEKSDLIKIAHGQVRMEDEWAKDANDVLICDTNLVVIKIWSEFKYGMVEKDILDSHASRKYDLHLLTYIDIPWQDDPQREHPDKREDLYTLYVNELKKTNTSYVDIRGDREQRQQTAIAAIDNLMRS